MTHLLRIPSLIRNEWETTPSAGRIWISELADEVQTGCAIGLEMLSARGTVNTTRRAHAAWQRGTGKNWKIGTNDVRTAKSVRTCVPIFPALPRCCARERVRRTSQEPGRLGTYCSQTRCGNQAFSFRLQRSERGDNQDPTEFLMHRCIGTQIAFPRHLERTI